MQTLIGKTFIIGRDPQQGGLLVCEEVTQKKAALKTNQPVPQYVSRCLPDQKTAHCKLQISEQGGLILTNMKNQNETLVNGKNIATKSINVNDKVELGAGHFRIDMSKIVATAKIIVGANQKPGQPVSPKGAVNISGLEAVWNRFIDGKNSVGDRQRQVNLIRTGSAIFTMCAMPCIAIFENKVIGFSLTGVGILGNLISFIGLKSENATKRIQELTDEFQNDYVCPKCGKFLGNMSYNLMKKQYSMKCPFCKVDYCE
ncbi:MAG: FHA domain-containing protein [Prevotella sp.]|nr:FHA domain-containing protein [Prevotella sp.]MCM1074744.1 FHA domain-containing protein [Ruminococcus sp.]